MALHDDPRYDSVKKRAQPCDEIVPQLRAALQACTALDWEQVFGESVPCAAARGVADMFDHPQVQAEAMVGSFSHPGLGGYRSVTRPWVYGRTPGPAQFAAPTLGQHSDAVRRQLDGG